MTGDERDERGAAARVRAWRRARSEAVCDRVEPWAHGSVLRTPRCPTYYDLNAVRVESDPGMSVEALVVFADEALDGLEHRRIDVEPIAVAEPLRAGFEARGWRTSRLLWMRHEAASPPPAAPIAVQPVAYDRVQNLRAEWLREEGFPEYDPDGFPAQERAVALARGVLVLAVVQDGAPIAFAQLERAGDGAEITQVYVRPDHRGGGRGTAMTIRAIVAAGHVGDLWICADDEDRPKELYARLGFRPVKLTMDFLLLP